MVSLYSKRESDQVIVLCFALYRNRVHLRGVSFYTTSDTMSCLLYFGTTQSDTKHKAIAHDYTTFLCGDVIAAHTLNPKQKSSWYRKGWCH